MPSSSKKLLASRSFLPLLGLLLLGTVGCTQTYVLSDEYGGPQYEPLRAEAPDRRVTLLLRDGRQFEGEKLHLEADTTRWMSIAQASTHRAPTSSIVRIRVEGSPTHRAALTRYGVLVGLGLGVLLRRDLSADVPNAPALRLGTYLLAPAVGAAAYAGSHIAFPDRAYLLQPPPERHLAGQTPPATSRRTASTPHER